MPLIIEIPDSALGGLGPSSEGLREELRRDLAVVLYARGALPIGQAMEFAGVNRRDFERLLKERQIRRPFEASDLADEVGAVD